MVTIEIMIIGLVILIIIGTFLLLAALDTEKRIKKSKEDNEKLKKDLLDKLNTMYKKIDLSEKSEVEQTNIKKYYRKIIMNFIEADTGFKRKSITHDPDIVCNVNGIYRDSINFLTKGNLEFLYVYYNLIVKKSGYEFYRFESIIMFKTKYDYKNINMVVLADKSLHVRRTRKKLFYYNKQKKEILKEKEYTKDIEEIPNAQKDLLEKLAKVNPDLNFSISTDNGIAKLRIFFEETEDYVALEDDILFIIDSILDEFGK